MPSAINRVPPGLLSLLGIKSFGTNPVQLADQLLPTLDLSDLYGEALIENITGTINTVNAVGQWEFTTSGTRFRPGPGELWIVRRLAVWASILAAGTSYRFSACTITAVTGIPTSIGDPISATVGEFPVVGHPAPFALTAQTAVAVWVHGLTLGIASNFSYAAQIVRLTI